jgi:hypothetical protein
VARHPDWFARLDSIEEVVRRARDLEDLGRKEIQAIFQCGERDSIRLLHKFGARERNDALSLPRSALLAQLGAVRAGGAYAAFLRRRRDVAGQLAQARAETAARQFRVRPGLPEERRGGLRDLPGTIAWRRLAPGGPARFEILYDDGADLMWQIAEFLSAAGVDRDEFFAGTEPADGASR